MSLLSTISNNKEYITISLTHSIFMLGQYVHFENFAYASLTNYHRSRPHFILSYLPNPSARAGYDTRSIF